MNKAQQEKALEKIALLVKSGKLTQADAVQKIVQGLKVTEAIAESILAGWQVKPQAPIIRSFHQLIASEKDPDEDDGKKEEPKPEDGSGDGDGGADVDLGLLADFDPENDDFDNDEPLGDDFDADFDTEDGFLDDVNNLDVFEGEATAKVTESDLLDAIKAIDKVAAAMLEEAGEGDGSGIAEADMDSIQDYISHLADFSSNEPSPAEIPDIPEEIAASYVHVLAVGDKPSQRFAVPKLSSHVLEGSGQVEIVSDLSRDPLAGLATEGPADGGVAGTIVVSVVNKITKSDKIQSRFLQLQPGWKDQGKENLEAWCYGLKVFSSAHGGMEPRDAKDWAAVQVVSQAYKDKHFSKPTNLRSDVSFYNAGVIRRVLLASQKYYGKFTGKLAEKPAAPVQSDRQDKIMAFWSRSNPRLRPNPLQMAALPVSLRLLKAAKPGIPMLFLLQATRLIWAGADRFRLRFLRNPLIL